MNKFLDNKPPAHLDFISLTVCNWANVNITNRIILFNPLMCLHFSVPMLSRNARRLCAFKIGTGRFHLWIGVPNCTGRLVSLGTTLPSKVTCVSTIRRTMITPSLQQKNKYNPRVHKPIVTNIGKTMKLRLTSSMLKCKNN